MVQEKNLHEGQDEDGCFVLDDDAVVDELEDTMCAGGVIVDTHSLVDYFPERWFDLVVVLRSDNTVLYDRLKERFGLLAKSENLQGLSRGENRK